MHGVLAVICWAEGVAPVFPHILSPVRFEFSVKKLIRSTKYRSMVALQTSTEAWSAMRCGVARGIRARPSAQSGLTIHDVAAFCGVA
jgi:hypothetical protein